MRQTVVDKLPDYWRQGGSDRTESEVEGPRQKSAIAETGYSSMVDASESNATGFPTVHDRGDRRMEMKLYNSLSLFSLVVGAFLLGVSAATSFQQFYMVAGLAFIGLSAAIFFERDRIDMENLLKNK